MADDIAQWLEGLGLGQYAEAFVENAVELRHLPHLSDDDLKELGLPLGPRRQLQAAIATLAAPEARPATAERRQLSVMFCDLVGSTELSHRLDPEELREVMRRYQDAAVGSITRYEGHIAKYLGDGVLAYFGWPRAFEDQAERAVRAGLDAVAAIQGVRLESGDALGARVGIATGRVVIGDIVGEVATQAEAVIGETPNLAARLQAMASPGQVVIGATTRLLVGETFELKDLGSHQLKGFAAPVAAWQVIGGSAAESRFEAAHPDAPARLVGRELSLGLLKSAWQRSQSEGGQVVLIGGEAGIGKSRLVDALSVELGDQGCKRRTFSGSPYHTNSALYPVICHLERALGWQGEDSSEAKLAKLEGAFRDSRLVPDEAVPLFASLLSLPLAEGRYPHLNMMPQQQKQRTLAALVAWWLEEAARQPVLQIWEDLHWADPSTLELLALEIEQMAKAPILTLITFRPEFVPPWPQCAQISSLTIGRLERPEVEALIALEAGGKALPEEVVAHIVGKTDGVPLFVEELTMAILEAGFLHERNGSYELGGQLSEAAIPATLQDSLMARLDRLPGTREVAQLGAVLGREFTYEMVRVMLPIEEPALRKGLAQLVDAELLQQQGLPPRATYAFKHALVRDAAYQSLLKRTRQDCHRQAAELIEARFPEIAQTQPELLAHHYSEAKLTERAVAYWQRAGEQALQRSANLEAIEHLGRGLRLFRELPETPDRAEQELAMELALGPALVATEGYAVPRVGQTYDRAWELCRQIGDSPHVFIVLRGRQLHEMLAGEIVKAREIAGDLMALAEQKGDSAMLVGGWAALAQTSFYLGDFSAARSHGEAGIDLYDRKTHSFPNWPGGHPGEHCCNYAALAAWMLGYPDRARRLAEEALTVASVEQSRLFSRANTLAHGALVQVFRREPESAKARVEASMEICREQGILHWLEWARVVQGWALAALGQGEDGAAEAHRALEAFRALGSRTLTAHLTALLVEVNAGQGRPDEALALLGEAFDVMERHGEHWWEAELHRLKGELLLARHDAAAAEQAFSRALGTARRQGAKSLELRAATSQARLRRAQGKTPEARDLLAPIYGWFTEGFDTPDLADAEALLDQLA